MSPKKIWTHAYREVRQINRNDYIEDTVVDSIWKIKVERCLDIFYENAWKVLNMTDDKRIYPEHSHIKYEHRCETDLF